MVVNDFLTLFLTMQAWVISNKLFYLLSSMNFLVLPFVIMVASTSMTVMEEGEDEGNKGLLSINRVSVGLVSMLVLYVWAMQPAIPLNLSSMEYNDVRSGQCGVAYTVPGDNTGTSWDMSYSSLGGETAYVPIWWQFLHSISMGITNGAVRAIPCNYDVTRSTLKLSEVSVTDPILLQETLQFHNQCFARAKSAMLNEGYQYGTVDKADLERANWLGDDYLVNPNSAAPKTVYSGIQSREHVPRFPYKASRDTRPNEQFAKTWRKQTVPKKVYPMCDEWWDDSTFGLRTRLAAEVKANSPEIYRDVMEPQGWFDTFWNGEKTAKERETMLVERALSVENIQASGRFARGYGASLDKTGERSIMEMVGLTGGLVGLEAGKVLAEPVFFVLRESLPIFQALLLSVLIIIIPLVLPIGLYSWRVLATMSVAYFGILFMTFWWEWCRSLESNMMTAIQQGHSNINPVTGVMNFFDHEVITVVLTMLYILVPGIWIGFLGFTGYQIGAVNSSFNQGIEKLSKTTQSGIDLIKQKAG